MKLFFCRILPVVATMLVADVAAIARTPEYQSADVMPCGMVEAVQHFKAATRNRIPKPLEGVWKLSSGALFAIESNGVDSYNIVLFDSPDLSLPGGVVAGRVVNGARPGFYDGELSKSVDRGLPSKRKEKVAIKLSDDALWIEISPYKKGVQLDLWRLIPYMFRFSIRTANSRPEGLNGARRIYPATSHTPDAPLVL